MTVSSDICDCPAEAPSSVWWRIGGGAFLAMNAMVLGLAANGSETTPDERYALELSILCVSGAVVVLLAKEFALAIWENIRRRRFGLEGLFFIGIAACLAVSTLSLRTGAGGTFADVAAMLLVIYSLGRQAGAYGKSKVLHSLADWAPERRRARLADSGEVVAASDVKAGCRLRILPGEALPVDARIVSGRATFQEASATGEAFPVDRAPGDTLTAGVFPIDASVDVEALTDGAESTLDQIRALVLAGLSIPGKEQRIANRVLHFFTPAIVLVAAAAFYYHASRLPVSEALFHALSVLVVACPCALGFATPLAVWSAIARLREIGILARSGDAVERLAEIDTVVFDKTGTLTLPGQSEVSIEWEENLGGNWRERSAEILGLLRAAEEASQHPLAKSLAPLWDRIPVTPLPQLTALRLLPGQGIEAGFADGRRLYAGGDIELRIDGELAARISRQERTSPYAAPAIAELERAGLRVILSTGDTAERAARIPIATQWTGQKPRDKHASLESLRGAGHSVLFAGDGWNDVAAMAWSDVSLTVGSSPALLREMSGLVLLDGDWRKLPLAIAIARAARRLVRANIAFSLAYNAVGVTLAAAGLLHPVAAALIMLFSSLTVILYSTRLMEQEMEQELKMS